VKTFSPIILASGSQTRALMLSNAGVTFEVVKAAVDEEAIKQSLTNEQAPPREIADVLAELKATQVSRNRVETGFPGDLVIGADQVLELDGQCFSKPADMDHAAAHLKLLRGKTHTLVSAVTVAHQGRVIWRNMDSAKLSVRDFSEEFLGDYLSALGDDALTSVGSYQIEGLGSQLFSKVAGDYFTILGMPLLPLLDFLRGQGALRV